MRAEFSDTGLRCLPPALANISCQKRTKRFQRVTGAFGSMVSHLARLGSVGVYAGFHVHLFDFALNYMHMPRRPGSAPVC